MVRVVSVLVGNPRKGNSNNRKRSVNAVVSVGRTQSWCSWTGLSCVSPVRSQYSLVILACQCLIGAAQLLWEDLFDVLVAEEDVDDLFPAVLERGVFDVNVRRQEELGVPGKALARGQVRNKPRRPIRVVGDVDCGALLLGEGRAQEAGPTVVAHLLLLRSTWRHGVAAVVGSNRRAAARGGRR